MGFLPVALATIVGSILGIISGYFGKAYAQIIMRTLDIFYAFPSILLAIALSSVLGSGLSSIIIPIAVILVPPIAGWPNPPCRISCRRTLLRRRRPPGPAR